MLMIIIIILKCNAAIQKWQRSHIKYRNIYVYIYEYSHLKVHTQCFPFPLNFLLASAGSGLIANRSASAGESLIMLSNFTVATPPPAPRFTSPFREQDVAEGEELAGGGQVDWLDEQHPLTISRPPRAGRSERQAEEDQVDRCRLFVEGDPTKNELYSPEYPNLYPKNINCTRVITGECYSLFTITLCNFSRYLSWAIYYSWVSTENI